MPSLRTRILLIGAVATGALTAGCPSVPLRGSLELPAADLTVRHYEGTLLSLPGAAEAVWDPDTCLAFTVEVVALERSPGTVFEALSTTAQFIASSVARGAFSAATRSDRLLRFSGRAEEVAEFRARLEEGVFGRHASAGRVGGVASPRVTGRITYAARERIPLPHRRDGVVESIEVRVGLTAEGGGLLAVAIQEVGEPPAGLPTLEGEPPRPPAEPRTLLTEEAVVPLPLDAGRGDCALVLRSPFEGGEPRALAVFVTLSPGPRPGEAGRPEFEALVARSRVEATRGEAAPDVPGEETLAPLWPGLESAASGLADVRTARSALSFLAQATEADLAEDLALGAPDPVFSDLVSAVRAELDVLPRPLAPGPVGFVLERSAFLAAISWSAREEAADAILSLAVRHAGEAGRYPSTLKEVLDTATDLPGLRAGLAAENRIFLEDNSPAARVRAYDWLAIRGEAPSGYDPLASREDRRRALRDAASGEEQ